jgi:hypothetical protein
MWILMAAAGLATVLLGLLVLRPNRKHTLNAVPEAPKTRPDSADRISSRSILSMSTVERSIASGAPPTPWMLRREDRAAMEAIQAYFARALPNPVPGGRPYIEESLGYGGPQIELKVPIISERRSVAVIFRSWDAGRSVLESNLYFAGTVNDRLSGIVSSAGFELRAYSDRRSTVFRSKRGAERQQSA